MTNANTDRRVIFGFLLAFALLALIPLLVYQNRGRLINDSQQVAHTQQIITSLESMMLGLSDADSDSREYVITALNEHLEHFEVAVNNVGKHLAALQTLTAQNALQQRRIEQLKPLIRATLADLQDRIDRRRAGSKEAASLMIVSDAKRVAFSDIRRIVADMRTEERRSLEAHKRIFQQSVSSGMTMFWGMSTLNFITLALSFVLVNKYMAHRRRTEKTLEQAKESAEAASIAKSSFLANMSHEIRTPMTAIIGYADNLLDPDQTSSDRQEALQVIRRNARHLMELINDVLDISKIEAGKMSTERIACDLPQLISEVVSLMGARAAEKGLNLQLCVDTPVPRRITTDALRVRQILVNLIGNAIKFTNSGTVQLRIGCTVDDGQAELRFDVIDTGVGISADQQARLFQPFSQADDSTTRRFGGSGLGLAISQRLARMLGGDITVQSQPGKGSRFCVVIDPGVVDQSDMTHTLTPAPAPISASSRRPISINARILLVDDGIDNQRLISSHLRKAGAQIVIADNGRSAVDLAMAERFDLIIMDMQMPDLDGYAATSELRRRGLELPIIAVTAHAMNDDRAKCLAAGCTDYLPKPIDRQHLLQTVKRHLTGSAEATPAAAAPDRPVLRSAFAHEDEIAEVLEQYVAGLPEQVAQLETLLELKQNGELRRLAHQLKGSGGGYGFMKITDAAAHLERLIDSGAHREDIVAGVQQLIEIIRSVEGYDAQATREAA